MKPTALLNFAVFVCLLVVGYRLSTRFYRADEAIMAEKRNIANVYGSGAVQSLNNGQRSILLVGVDALDSSDPQLISLWLLSYLQSDATMHFFPIFPSGNDRLSNFEISLPRSFGLKKENGDLSLSQGFVNLLVDNNYWWSGYLVFDQVGQSKMIDLLNGVENSAGMISGPQIVDEQITGRQDYQEAYRNQMSLVQAACHMLPGFIQNHDWSEVVSLAPTHIFTDMDTQHDMSEWLGSLPSQLELNCKFPTLELSRNSN